MVNAIETQIRFLHAREREHQATFRAYFFGPFRLLHNNKPSEGPIWRRTKTRALLKWFLLHPDEPLAADHLIELFWPDAPLETGYQNLRVNIHYIRHLLEPSIGRGEKSRYIHHLTNNFYIFHKDDSWWVDLWELQRQFAQAKEMDQQGMYTKAAWLYRKAVTYFEQNFLPEDIYEAHIDPYRHHYERLHVQFLSRLIEIGLQNNDFDETLDHAYLLLNIDPYNEQAAKAIITIYCKQGYYSGARSVLKRFWQLLKSELGIEPSSNFCRDMQNVLELPLPSDYS